MKLKIEQTLSLQNNRLNERQVGELTHKNEHTLKGNLRIRNLYETSLDNSFISKVSWRNTHKK